MYCTMCYSIVLKSKAGKKYIGQHSGPRGCGNPILLLYHIYDALVDIMHAESKHCQIYSKNIWQKIYYIMLLACRERCLHVMETFTGSTLCLNV